MKAMRQIGHPSEHDWTGQLCTFMAQIEDGRPVLTNDGRICPGTTKLSGTVTGQRYLGNQGIGLIPNFEISVRGSSGAVVKIGLLENNFQLIN